MVHQENWQASTIHHCCTWWLGWKEEKINGLTIFFIDPETLDMYRILLALTRPSGKSSLEICRTSMLGLDRMGVEFEDLFRAANDNCNIAVKAGRL